MFCWFCCPEKKYIWFDLIWFSFSFQIIIDSMNKWLIWWKFEEIIDLCVCFFLGGKEEEKKTEKLLNQYWSKKSMCVCVCAKKSIHKVKKVKKWQCEIYIYIYTLGSSFDMAIEINWTANKTEQKNRTEFFFGIDFFFFLVRNRN